MLDVLLETPSLSATLAVLHSRLNQKIEVLSVSQSSLRKSCSSIIANNYYRSLDYCSSSFKQLDAKRMTPKGSFDFSNEILEISIKYCWSRVSLTHQGFASFLTFAILMLLLAALLSEAKEMKMKSSITGVKHLSSSCNNQYHLVSDDPHHYSDLHINEDIDGIISYASQKKFSSEHKPVMIWKKLVQSFVSGNCQLPELNCTAAPKESCERCGLSKNFLRRILDVLLAKNFPLPSKVYTGHMICIYSFTLFFF